MTGKPQSLDNDGALAGDEIIYIEAIRDAKHEIVLARETIGRSYRKERLKSRNAYLDIVHKGNGKPGTAGLYRFRRA